MARDTRFSLQNSSIKHDTFVTRMKPRKGKTPSLPMQANGESKSGISSSKELQYPSQLCQRIRKSIDQESEVMKVHMPGRASSFRVMKTLVEKVSWQANLLVVCH